MSDPRGHDHEPDRAALDELLRAFADDGSVDDPHADSGTDGDRDEPLEPTAPTPAPDTRDDDDPLDDDAPDGDDVPDDDHDDVPDHDVPADGVAADPGPAVAPATDATAAPSVIRIDDDHDHDDHDDHDDSIDPDLDEPDWSDAHHGPGIAGEPQLIGVIRHDDSVPDDTTSDAAPSVISIDDADLPDAVYIKGSLDADRSTSIVFIEDDDTGDALVPETERDVRRGIEPRMRERRLAVRRAHGRKRLKWALAIGLVIMVVVGALAVLGSSLFAVRADQVEVTGDVYTDPEALQAVVDDLIDTPVLRVDIAAAERDLEAIPWVDEARVTTDFPHGASIDIREREALTSYQGPDGRFRVLDREGRVLDVLDQQPTGYFEIGGPDPVDLDAGEFAPRGYGAASELARNLTGSVRGQVDFLIVASDGSSLSMFLDDGTEVRFGEASDLFAKLVRLETVMSTSEARDPGVIDVSTNEVTL